MFLVSLERDQVCLVSRAVRALTFASISALGILACESTSAPVPVRVYEHHVTAEMVTGAALAALQSDGRINLETPATSGSQLSVQEAGAQALQFARYVTNNGLLRGVVEGGRGGYWTDPHLLTLCRNAYFVHSQLGSIPADSVPATAAQSFQRRFGPQWIIPMCGQQDDPQMTVQAAVDGNDIRFANGEPIEPYTGLTMAWFPKGVPLNWPDPLPLSAERAVRFAWETFGVRVTEVPQLYFRGQELANGTYAWHGIGSTNSCNRWRVTLENDVRVRGMTSFQEFTTRILWIASGTCYQWVREPFIHIPLADQPTTARLDYFDDSVSPTKVTVIDVPVVVPIRFEIGTRVP